MGRDYTNHFWVQNRYDAFGSLGVGTSQALVSSLGGNTAVRASNMVMYSTPNMSGFGASAQYFLGDNVSSVANDGKGISLGASYINGPISATLAYAKSNYAVGDITTTGVGGSYDFGAAKLMALYDQDKNGAVTGKGFNVGVHVPVGVGLVRASYSSYKTDAAGTPKSNKLALGYVHNLSKRTALYTTVARVTNSGGASSALAGSSTAANGSSTGYDFGVRHSF